MELIFGMAFAVLLVVFVGVGLMVGATAEGPDPGPPGRSPLKVRATRAALLAVAAFMAVLGAEAALVAGWQPDPSAGRTEAMVFLLEGVVDLALALLVLKPAWTLRRIWVLRLVAACWVVVGPVALVLTFDVGPLATFYLGLGPDLWATVSVVVGVVLVWLSSLGGGDLATVTAEPVAPTSAAPSTSAPDAGPPVPPTRWRGIVTGVALASLVAISSWPLAQFVGVNALGGCTAQWLVPSDPGFCLTSKLDAQSVLIVYGETTLPDGAVVDVSASSDDAGVGDPLSEQHLAISGGKFQATFDLSRRLARSVTVYATLNMAEQPTMVAQRYGADGRAMTGPSVRTDGANGGRRLLATLHVDLG